MRERGLYISLIAALLVLPVYVLAQSATATPDAATSDLQAQIDANNAQISQLDSEITQYQKQLDATTVQKNTLQNTINQLALQQKQLNAKISVTKNQIKTTQLQIQQLARGIAQAQGSINDERAGLAQSLRTLNRAESTPLAISMLSAQNIGDAWRDADASASLQSAVQDDMQALAEHKQSLTDTKTQAEAKQKQLQAQQATLNVQQNSLAVTKKAQGDLLADTKDQEANYQKIIAEKQAEKQDFEATLNDLQSKLQSADTSGIPLSGKGVLSWPLKSVYVTQYFGNTAFAQSGAYNGKGHNGIDLRASIGTPVYAALSGVVVDTNLGSVRYCQYGKWILIRHNNGLDSLYGHLSQINVTPGESVSTGQLIGYSGDTGYATGPHLHFTVYVASAVTFTNYKCNGGKVTKIPIAPFNAYLNPISYLP